MQRRGRPGVSLSSGGYMERSAPLRQLAPRRRQVVPLTLFGGEVHGQTVYLCGSTGDRCRRPRVAGVIPAVSRPGTGLAEYPSAPAVQRLRGICLLFGEFSAPAITLNNELHPSCRDSPVTPHEVARGEINDKRTSE